MRLVRFKYVAIFSVPILGFFSIKGFGMAVWLLPTYIFILVPFIELWMQPDERNLSETEAQLAQNDPFYDSLLYLIVPIQYGVLYLFLKGLALDNLSLAEWWGRVLSMGILCGALGINVAHELGHRTRRHETLFAKLLLLTSLYMHFIIEHNRGHHKKVSTPDDPASARRGETVYGFWLRSVRDSYSSAWHLEAQRLEKKQLRFWSYQNEMIWFSLIQLGFVASIGLTFGLKSWLGFVAAAILGFLLLETVNYIEHYGLARKKRLDGHYERVQPAHSWNSNHVIGRLLLFELSRHSDHHFEASRKYQVLRHFEESPQMPTGYPGMILLSLIPPLWFWVMHKRIEN